MAFIASGASHKEPHMKWEYIHADVGLGSPSTIQAKLDVFGRQGWELVSITGAVAWFKRPARA